MFCFVFSFLLGSGSNPSMRTDIFTLPVQPLDNYWEINYLKMWSLPLFQETTRSRPTTYLMVSLSYSSQKYNWALFLLASQSCSDDHEFSLLPQLWAGGFPVSSRYSRHGIRAQEPAVPRDPWPPSWSLITSGPCGWLPSLLPSHSCGACSDLSLMVFSPVTITNS